MSQTQVQQEVEQQEGQAEEAKANTQDAAGAGQEEHEHDADGAEAFVNRGLEVWLERQRQWRSEGSSEEAMREQEESRKRKRSYAPTVTVEELLSFQPLPHAVPLEEAVELLAELWESEEPF